MKEGERVSQPVFTSNTTVYRRSRQSASGLDPEGECRKLD